MLGVVEDLPEAEGDAFKLWGQSFVLFGGQGVKDVVGRGGDVSGLLDIANL